jgi:hypothetical protein
MSAELLRLLSEEFRFRLRRCAGSGPNHLLLSTFSLKYDLGIMPYNSGKVHRRFGRTYRFHLQSLKVSETINQQEWDSKQSTCFQRLARLLLSLFLGLEDGDDTLLRNIGELLSN